MTGVPQKGCADRRGVSCWFFSSFLRFAFLVCAALVPAAAQVSDDLPNANSSFGTTPEPEVGPAVWFADHHRAHRVPLATHQVDHVIPLAHEIAALAVDPRDRSLWVLSHKHLLKFDAHTSLVRDVDLDRLVPKTRRYKAGKRGEKETPKFEKIEDPKALALNPHDGTLWVRSEKMLLHVDEIGDALAVWRSPEKIEALSLSLDESIWVLTQKHLIHLSKDAGALASYPIASRGRHAYRHLAVDALGGVVWLADKYSLHQLSLADLSTGASSEVYPGTRRDSEKSHRPHGDDDEGDDDDRQIEGLALDSLTGAVWAAHKRSVLGFRRDGTPLGTADLSQGIRRIETLAFDEASRSLFIGGKRALVQLGGDAVVVAKLVLDRELEALGVSPMALVPRLSLLQPGLDVVTNNAKLPLRLGLGALCNSAACEVGPVYPEGITLDVVLNGQAIGPDFTHSAGEVVYVPTERYPEGPNTFTAQARDAFGHLSAPVSGRFVVDTTPPVFLSVSPADGSTVATPELTLEGRLDDAAAVVTLEELAALGGTLMRDDPLDFSFRVPLKPGANAFTLVATDTAGNQARKTLAVTLASGLSVNVDNLADGATVATDRILVMGTFEGPLNTGITVNGQIAQTYGQRFFANNIALHPGENKLVIIATTLGGAKREQTLTITSTAPAKFTIERTTAFASMRTLAGTGVDGFVGDGGPATEAVLSWPYGVAVGHDGSVYIADTYNDRVRRVLPDGSIVTVAGNGQAGFSGDGGPATDARLDDPYGIAVGTDGSLYIADTGNRRVREVGPDGMISTVAGRSGDDGIYEHGDGGPATQAWLTFPMDVTVGPDGRIYIADTDANRIRMVAPDGTITTLAGTGEGGDGGDGGPATGAQLNWPYGVTASADGSVYIADSGNNRIRRVTPDGTITTVAGTGEYGNAGDGGPATAAQLGWPASVALGPDGSLYITDNENNRVRRVTPEGIIVPVAGTGTYGYGGDGGSPPAAHFAWPYDAALGPDGTLYVADTENHRIRAFTTLNTNGTSAPLLVGFRLGTHTTGPIQRVEADYDGDGTVDFSTTDATAALQHYYAQSGAYVAQFTVTGAEGAAHTLEYAVVLFDVRETDTMLRTVYSDMLASLKAQDVDAALKAVTGGAYEKYKSVFTTLHADLPQVVDQLGELQGGIIGEGMAEYAVVREVNGKKMAFLFYFLRSEDGVWRIDGM